MTTGIGTSLPPLTSALFNEILFAMEDQGARHVFLPDQGRVVPAAGQDGGVPLPRWTSRDGFALMVRFAGGLGNRELSSRLMKVLDSHKKGVFRSFRGILDGNPEALEAWWRFKKAAMGKVVRSWYLDLGLPVEEAVLDADNPALEDFVFQEGALGQEEEIRRLAGIGGFPSLVCLSPAGELEGFLLSSPDRSRILSYWVREEMRRLGIFSVLLERFLASLRNQSPLPEHLEFPVYPGYEFVANLLAPFRPQEVRAIYRCHIV